MISLSTSFLFFGTIGEVAYKEVFSFFDAKHNWNGSNSRIHVLHFFLSSAFYFLFSLSSQGTTLKSLKLFPSATISSQESL